jgi:hypothetical protein
MDPAPLQGANRGKPKILGCTAKDAVHPRLISCTASRCSCGDVHAIQLRAAPQRCACNPALESRLLLPQEQRDSSRFALRRSAGGLTWPPLIWYFIAVLFRERCGCLMAERISPVSVGAVTQLATLKLKEIVHVAREWRSGKSTRHGFF